MRRALRWLGDAVEWGHLKRSGVTPLSEDVALAFLRGDPAFEAPVAKDYEVVRTLWVLSS